ncbi:hypothetical protein RB595_004415 [Gaeumannomyces hyphopodioides]
MGSTFVSQALAIPKGSLVLVTGASSYVATSVVLEFLTNGYRVRGTVRNRAKAAYFHKGVFEKYAQDGTLELVDVPDMAVPGAYKDSVKGVAAIINLATILTMDPDPEKVVPATVFTMTDLLRTAAAEHSVKRFVHCSTIGTLYHIGTAAGNSVIINQASWNDEAVREAYSPPPHGPEHGLAVYQASKVLAERAAWKLIEEEKPDFVFNTVHPVVVFGPLYTRTHVSSSAGWLMSLYDGTGTPPPEKLKVTHVNVKDVAAVHYAAAVDPDMKSQRIITSGEGFNWNTVLGILRQSYPDRKFRDDIPGVEGLPSEIIDADLGLSLLKKWAGRGWIPLDQSIRETVESVV